MNSELDIHSASTPTIDAELEEISTWGMSKTGRSRVFRPTSPDELALVLARAHSEGRSIGFRGTGCSYGDASLNSGGYLVDSLRWNRIRHLDTHTGILDADPGVTIEQIWRTALPHGFWPSVVPGTMFPTLAGCAAMNIHGKNNFQAGTIGEHILDFDLLLADGSRRTCSRTENSDLFHAAIGGLGLLGAFTRIRLKLKRVHSGDLRVRAVSTASISEMISYFEAEAGRSDYLVGWVDALASGRGLIHQAWYLHEGEDRDPRASFLKSHQDLPARILGVLPRSWVWPGLWLFLNRPGMRFVNALKFHQGVKEAKHPPHRQSLVGFSFLLDYVPRWKYAYKPGGLIQYQAFVPKTDAARVFDLELRLAKEAGIQPFLGVLKKHRVDPFLLTHAVDGYSLALDFPYSPRNARQLLELTRRMDEVVLTAGGRFYFAKDSVMTPESLRRAYSENALSAFQSLKSRCDPGHVFQTDLSRRVFEPLG